LALWLARVQSHPRASSETVLLEDARRELSAAEVHYAQAVSDLRRLAEAESRSWRPDQSRAFADSLRTIDDAIARARASAHRTDADPAAMESLFAAYRRQIDFLRDAIEQGAVAGRELEPL
jgi:hypothetical protein